MIAFGIFCIMCGAIGLIHFRHGFFMNWFGSQGGEGYEYHLLVLGVVAALAVTGGGRWSVVGWLQEHLWQAPEMKLNKAVPAS